VIGTTLGAYKIESELGRGGMGAVYTAVHSLLGRRAAVKVLLAELSKKEELVNRFFNEAKAATAIKHPSIVEIYDFGWAPDGSAYIVMELMRGEPLSSRLKRFGRLPVPIALTITRQVANALHAAHQAGIIHRDLKPDNVFLVPDVEVAGGERVKLLDFGIAKLTVEGQASQTSTGAVMGTPVYMSPAQCEGARLVDPRSDLYSLGCMLFEMISGRPPFQSEGIGGLIGMHLFVAAPPLRSVAPDAPPEVEELVAKLLAKAPADRYQSADELATAVGRLGAVSGAIMAAAPMPSYPGVQPAPSYPAGQGPPSHPGASSQPPSYPGGHATPPPSYPGGHATPPPSYPHAQSPSYPGAQSGPTTTLSSAASASSMAPSYASTGSGGRSRRGLWLGLGGLAVAGATVAVVLAAGGGGGDKVAAVTTQDAGAAAVATTDASPESAAASDAAVAVVVAVDAGPASPTSSKLDARAAKVDPRAPKPGPYAPGDPLAPPGDPVNPTPTPRPRPEPTTGPLPTPPAPTTGLPKPPTPTPPPTPQPEPGDDGFDKLHEAAKNAGFEGNFDQALALCQRSLKLRPREPRALFNCATFSCELGKYPLMNRYIDMIPAGADARLREKAAHLREICVPRDSAPKY
jgi:serine/threonine-protein kinase